jgi:Fe-Mn family superoxide dismutase
LQDHFPFQKTPLPYEYISLTPYCDPNTLLVHHKNLYGQYVDTLNYLLSPYPQYHSWTLEQLILDDMRLPVTVERNIKHFAGAVYNHDLYFGVLSANPRPRPAGALAQNINATYGSIENFRNLVRQAAHNVLGSGWVWLNTDSTGNLHIAITPNNRTPALRSFTPLFTLDVWEHAFTLRYPANLGAYVDGWFQTLDWEKVEARYNTAVNPRQG